MSDELNNFFPRPKPVNTSVLGTVVAGSLSKGLEVKLSPDRLIEGLAVGRYVVVHGQTGRRFFGMITDVVLESRHPEVEQSPPEDPDGFLARVYRGILTYGRVHVTPMLVLDEAGAGAPGQDRTGALHPRLRRHPRGGSRDFRRRRRAGPFLHRRAAGDGGASLSEICHR